MSSEEKEALRFVFSDSASLQDLVATLAANPNVTELSLVGLTDLPNELTEFRNIEALTLTVYGDDGILETFCELPNLRRLRVESQEPLSIPASIGDLRQLQHFEIDAYYLPERLPDAMGQLVNLESIEFGGDELYLPIFGDWILELKQLKKLKLVAPHGFPNEDGVQEALTRLSQLESLSFHRHYVHEVPESIGNLTALKELNLSSRIGILPETIGQLSNLRKLGLSGNELESLPVSLARLTQLEELDLSHQEAEIDIAQSVKDMTQLKIVL